MLKITAHADRQNQRIEIKKAFLEHFGLQEAQELYVAERFL
jgi:hypothetical protein